MADDSACAAPIATRRSLPKDPSLAASASGCGSAITASPAAATELAITDVEAAETRGTDKLDEIPPERYLKVTAPPLLIWLSVTQLLPPPSTSTWIRPVVVTRTYPAPTIFVPAA